MAIALTILKIIGISILVLIAVAILIIAVVLFVPVRYRISGNMEQNGKPFGKAGVSFLLHILSASFVYDNEASYSVRLFGIKIRPKKKKEKPTDTGNDTANDTAVNVADAHDPIEGDKPDDKPGDIPEPEDYTIDWNEDPFEEEEYSSEPAGKIETFIDKLVSRYEALSDKYERIRRNIRFWDRMINDTRNKEAFELIKSKFLHLLKKVAPRKISGFVHFGFEDPATLGKILVYVSIIYPVLPRKLRLEPSFEDTDIYGNIDIKGHICLITPLVCLARIYFNKDCRRMWRLYKKHTQSS